MHQVMLVLCTDQVQGVFYEAQASRMFSKGLHRRVQILSTRDVPHLRPSAESHL